MILNHLCKQDDVSILLTQNVFEFKDFLELYGSFLMPYSNFGMNKSGSKLIFKSQNVFSKSQNFYSGISGKLQKGKDKICDFQFLITP